MTQDIITRAEAIYDWLFNNSSKYLHNPLNDSEKALVRDVLAAQDALVKQPPVSGEDVERVAEAIYDTQPAMRASSEAFIAVPVLWEEAVKRNFGKVEDCRRYAKAAIAALNNTQEG